MASSPCTDASKVSESAGTPVRSSQSSAIRACSTLTGQLADRADEHAFWEATRADRCGRLRSVATVGAVAYLAGGVVDWLLVGSTTRFVWLMAIRIAVALPLFAAAQSLGREPRREDQLVFPMLLVVDIATCAIIALSPGVLLNHALTVLTIILVTYLFVPARTLHLCASAMLFSTAFVAVCINRIGIDASEMALTILYLTLANVLGILTVRDQQLANRRVFLTRRGEAETHATLEAEAAERRTVEDALSKSEAKYRELVEMSPNAIAVHRDGTVVYVNPTGLRLLGTSDASAVVGRSIFEMVAPRHHDLISDRMRSMTAEPRTLPVVELEIRCLDGRRVLCELVSGPTTFDGRPAIQSVVRDVTERRILEDELRRLATIDPLTDLCNRRRFFQQLEAEWRRAHRHGHPLSLLMIDLDRFKRINDSHGHAVGDQALIGFVRTVENSLRSSDCFARVGGEEFAVILPETNLDGAVQLAERCRESVASTAIPSAAGALHLTASFGVAECALDDETTDQALRRADDALLLAKSHDRNRVEAADPPVPGPLTS